MPMGLDIYFSKVVTLPENVKESDAKKREIIYAKLEEIEAEMCKYDESSPEYDKLSEEYDFYSNWYTEYTNEGEEVAYFRKVNFLIPFFGYEENCSNLEITRQQILDIVDACTKVLEDHSKAEELLPTTGGFFFGSTDYDQWYFDDVKDALDKFNTILEMMPESEWNTYHVEMHCWW